MASGRALEPNSFQRFEGANDFAGSTALPVLGWAGRPRRPGDRPLPGGR